MEKKGYIDMLEEWGDFLFLKNYIRFIMGI